jgi:hypothetical protein
MKSRSMFATPARAEIKFLFSNQWRSIRLKAAAFRMGPVCYARRSDTPRAFIVDPIGR